MRAEERTLTCRDATAFLDAYLDDSLDARERMRFDAHLAECEDCRRYLEQYESTHELCRAAFDDPVDAGVPEELVEAILAARAAARPPRSRT